MTFGARPRPGWPMRAFRADIAKVLNHTEGGPRATMVYNRHAYDREKRLALETWARGPDGYSRRQSQGMGCADYRYCRKLEDIS
jgi:hypothetical protein